MKLLEMSLAGGALIAVITLVRLIARRRLPAAVFPALWVVAALRLLVPVFLTLPVALPLGGAAQPGKAAFPGQTVLWLMGAMGLGLYFVSTYRRWLARFRSSLPDTSPQVRKWLAAHRLRRPLAVRCSDEIASPLTYGVLRPVILLPKGLDRRDEALLDHVLTHEWIHVRRLDAVWKCLFAAALTVHWFNPLVWLLFFLANRDLELACDGAVLASGGDRSGYAAALLRLAECRGRWTPLSSGFCRHALEERILAAVQFRKPGKPAAAVAAVLLAATALAFCRGAAPVKVLGQVVLAASDGSELQAVHGTAVIRDNEVVLELEEALDLQGVTICYGDETEQTPCTVSMPHP